MRKEISPAFLISFIIIFMVILNLCIGILVNPMFVIIFAAIELLIGIIVVIFILLSRLKLYYKVINILAALVFPFFSLFVANTNLKYGVTLGAEISFNQYLWNINFANTIRYSMKNDIKNYLDTHKPNRDQIVQLLGESSYGDGYSFLVYLLKPGSIMGLAMHTLDIRFEKGEYLSSEIVYSD